MKKLIINANIITNSQPNEIRGGFIGIIGDEIAFVGEGAPVGDAVSGVPLDNFEIIDAEGSIVMPGFVNAHTHIPMTLFRGVADDITLQDWLFNHIQPLEAKMTPEDVYKGSKLALQEMVESGTTCLCDMYNNCDQIIKATTESGLRANIDVGLSSMVGGVVGANCVRPSELFKEQKRTLEEKGKQLSDKIKLTVSYHTLFTTSHEFIKHCAELSAPFNIHISETLKENEDCIKEHGKTPTALLKSLGYFKKEQTLNAAHCVYLTDADIEIFAESGAGITHCPSSNLKLASGIAPIKKYLDSGINVALGTDGAASNNALDMFNEVRLAALLHKGATGNPTAITAQTAIEMATVNGAKALGRENEIGKIAKGYKADLIFIETKSANMQPLATSLCSAIAYSASSKNITHTIISGEIKYIK